MRIVKEVTVCLDEVIANDLEGFLNLLEELCLADYDEEERSTYYLSDIGYKITNHNDEGMVIEVDAELETIE